MRRRWTMGIALLLVALGWAQAAGFSVRGAVRFDSRGFGLESELEYNDKLTPEITWGVRASLRAVPLDTPLVLIVPNAYLEYRTTLSEGVQGVGVAELGVGILPQFFPRAVLRGGVDARYKLGDLDVFGQARLNFDFIPTDRATPSLSGRFGVILIPFVPYVGGEYGYNFIRGISGSDIFVGSLLYLSEQFFLGLEGGFNGGGFSGPYVRLLAQYSQQ